MINFHEKGDPAQLLKGIAPSEAELLDPAVSACVRFRLGGSSFPPMIFFKFEFLSKIIRKLIKYICLKS